MEQLELYSEQLVSECHDDVYCTIGSCNDTSNLLPISEYLQYSWNEDKIASDPAYMLYQLHRNEVYETSKCIDIHYRACVRTITLIDVPFNQYTLKINSHNVCTAARVGTNMVFDLTKHTAALDITMTAFGTIYDGIPYFNIGKAADVCISMSQKVHKQLPDHIKMEFQTHDQPQIVSIPTRATTVSLHTVISHTDIQFSGISESTRCHIYMDSQLLCSFNPTHEWHRIRYYGNKAIKNTPIKENLHKQIYDARNKRIQIHCTHGATVKSAQSTSFIPYNEQCKSLLDWWKKDMYKF